MRQYGLPPHMAAVQRQLQKKKENVVNVAFACVRCIYISPGEPITGISVKFTEIAVTLLILLVALCGRRCGHLALCGRIRRGLPVILSVYSL